MKNSLKFVPKGPINNIPAMVQIMACRRPGDKPLSGPMVVSLPTHICVARPQWVKNPTKWLLVIYTARLTACGLVMIYGVWRRQTGSTLDQVSACRLLGAKSLLASIADQHDWNIANDDAQGHLIGIYMDSEYPRLNSEEALLKLLKSRLSKAKAFMI